MAILESLTIGNQQLLVADSNPVVSGVSAELGSIIILNDGSGLYTKTNTSNTSWSKLITLNNLTDITSVGTVTSGIWQGTAISDTYLSINNTTVTGKLLTGYVSGAGTITATDSILTAIQKLNGNIAAIGGGGVSLTPGYVFYAGATGTGTGSSRFFWDETNNTLTLTGIANEPGNGPNLAVFTNDNLIASESIYITSNGYMSIGSLPSVSDKLLVNGGRVRVSGVPSMNSALRIDTGRLEIGGTGNTTDSLYVAGVTTTTGDIFSTGNLTLNGSSSMINIPAISDPATPDVNTLDVYAKNIANRIMLKWLGPSGVDTPLQPNIFFNNFSLFSPSSGTSISLIGNGSTVVGTVSNPTPTSTNLKTQTRRFAVTSATGQGSLASLRVGVLECWRGNAAGLGGFFIVCRFSIDTAPNNMRMFAGLTDTATTAPTNIDPTTNITPGKIGMAINANVGSWNIVHNTTGVAPTVINLGANFPINTTDFIEFILFAAPNSATVSYRVTNMTTNAQTTGVLSTNLPANTTFLGRTIWSTNNTTGAAASWSCSKFGLESDY